MASPGTVITLGFGNGTLIGSAALILTLGYGLGDVEAQEPVPGIQFTHHDDRLDFVSVRRGDFTSVSRGSDFSSEDV